MHGGDVYRNKVKYDFSISVNPLGMPQAVREAVVAAVSDAEKYPDIQCESLRRAISGKLGCPQENVVCGNGASELIRAFLRSVCGMNAKHQDRPKKVMIPVPCFTGYESAIDSVNACVGDVSAEYFFLPGITAKNPFCMTSDVLPAFFEKFRASKTAACIITNPNNPNGKLIERAVLEEIASECEKTGTWLLIDECFMELTGKADGYSFIPLLSRYKCVIVLRAFTKTFAIPGLRLGYCVTSCAETATVLRNRLPEWNVSAPAQAAGVAAVKEDVYIKEALHLISEERQFLTAELKELGFTVFPSDANFLLFCVAGAQNSTGTNLFDAFLADGILIRDCRDIAGLGEGFYRIAVRKHAENEVLVNSLKKFCRATK